MPCGSSDDDEVNNNNNGGFKSTSSFRGIKVNNPPEWTFSPETPDGDIGGLPDWEEVDFYDYDNNMTVIVFVSTGLGIEVTDDDRMAAIINGEVRDVCGPVFYDIPDIEEPLRCFMLYIPFVYGDNDVELQYYNVDTLWFK